jgi:hypothetical protein
MNRFSRVCAGAACLVAGLATGLAGQVATATADPADVATVDGIIAALYASISGPAGPRQWHRFHSLFLPGAILISARPRPDSLPPPPAMSPSDFRRQAAPHFRDNPFHEVESGRATRSFGTVTHVWSTYESRRDPAEAPFARGINSIDLVRHDGRWWIASIVWDSERPGNPLP